MLRAKITTTGDVLRLIGRTPLLQLHRLTAHLPSRVEVHAKAEWFNPGGSVKDRPALRMVQEAIKEGSLSSGKRILDATSGNTGIGLALVGRALGFPVTLTLPANASAERKRILQAYGAELVFTSPLESTDGAQRKAKEMAAARPDLFCYLDQYNNPANWRAHYDTTGPEILQQTGGRVTHLVAGLGTSGTLMGAGRRLHEAKPGVKLIGVQPAEPLHGIEGLKHMASAMVPGIFSPQLLDDQIFVSTSEAQKYARLLAVEEALLVGTSSGAALGAALRVAEGLEAGVVVAVFPDGGDRYLGEEYWRGP